MSTKCYIGFSSPNKFKIGAKLISWWMNKPYSHSYIRFESDTLSTIYQASHGMVHFREFGNFKQDNVVIVEYSWDLAESSVKKLMREAVFLAGEEYAYRDLPAILFYDITGIDLGDNKGFVCSALVGKLYSEYQNYDFNKPIHLLKPNDMEDALLYG